MAKPSITYWNRVEPTPRSDSLTRGLEAAVRDPVWFLARQWQMGEFAGEDAGSPSSVGFRASLSRFQSWRAGAEPARPFAMEAPLEALIESEEVTPDWLLAVELGQRLEHLLGEQGASDVTVGLFRTAYPVPRVAELSAAQRRDEALVRFLRICGGRGIDGVAALAAARLSAPSVPPEVAVSAGVQQSAAEGALQDFIAWAAAAYGPIGRGDAPAWRPERLDYDVEVTALTPGGDKADMRAVPGANGEFDWYSFDEVRREASEREREQLAFSLLPTNVYFAGMPNSRWWQFEDARFNWTNVDTDRREIAKTMVLDFMLVQGNDWFLVPFAQKVGSLVTVDQLLVRDVFGEYTLVRRADAQRAEGRPPWTMFSTAIEGLRGERVADYFILPPSALRTTLDGPDLEEVRFLRDEQANLVWAIEHRIENGVGRGWLGHERALTFPDETPTPPDTVAPLRYQLQTNVPVHWIPFPPVQIDSARRVVALERAAMQRFIDGALVRVQPVGRTLRPTNLADSAIYRINEEEVSRAGTRIIRAVRRSRWLDGSTHLWISRRRRAGLGEGSSGLRYDIAEQTGAEVRVP